MASSPIITVLMGVFNSEDHISEAIQSILQQTLVDIELLIIDDCSTDSTRDIVNSFAEKDSRIRLMCLPENHGLGYCLNLGVQEASCELIARMDGDDVSVKFRLEHQLSHFQQSPTLDVLGSWALNVDENGCVGELRKVPLTQLDIESRVWSNPFIHSTVMFRRSSILAVGSYNPLLRKRQDYDLWFRAVSGGLQLKNLPEVLLNYRFTERTFRRNSVKVMWQQALIGVRGCRRVGAPWISYVYVMYPFIRSLFPVSMQRLLYIITRRFDPRLR